MMPTKCMPASIVRLVATLALLLTGSLNTTALVDAASTAQEEAAGGLWSMGIGARTTDAQGNIDHTVGAHFTVTSESGEFVGECTLQEPPNTGVAWWNCRVDVPSDRISLVWEDPDSVPAGYAPVENPITFDPTTFETGPHDIGALFDNVPVADATSIKSDSSPSNSGSSTFIDATSARSPGAVDISLIIRDPNDGSIVVGGTCFSLLESGAEACDDGDEGQVAFDAISPGTYTVHQTRTPAGYSTVNDFPITIEDRYPKVPVGYLVNQSADQNGVGTRNLSVVFVDSETLTKIIPSPICATVVGASEEGCDLVLVDGQIGFLGIQTGTYPLNFSQVPADWTIVDGKTVTISDGIGPQIHFVLVDTGGGSGSGSGTTSKSTSGSTTSPDAGSSATTGTTTSGATSTVPFTIGAHNCSNVTYGCPSAVGAHFTVTTEEGEPIGECTLEDTGSPRGSRCSVDVPFGIVVIVTEDVTTIDPNYTPESNPIRFDTSVAPLSCDSCDWGPTFTNGVARSDNASSDELVMWSRSCDDSGSCQDAVGARFMVTTESGEPLGECMLEAVVANPARCSVTVPLGGVVIVTEDVSTLPPGLAPESNPIRIDTAVEPFSACAPCHWGPNFRNGPATSTSSTTTTTKPTTSSSSGSASTGKTWTASVQVNLCDAPPGSGTSMNCTAGAGVTVNIALASGETLGSCTTGDPIETPWDTEISLCSVPGMPFNADLVATQDPATLPPGYAPSEETLSLHVDDLTPGGGDQATFTFFDVRTSNSTSTSGPSDATGSATLVMTFRGCPEGFDPAVGDFYAECTIPLDAPDASFLYHGGDGQGGINIAWLDRRDDGAYIFSAGPHTMNLELSGLAPVVRDAYQVFGADGASGESYTVSLVDGEVREITVFYYYEP